MWLPICPPPISAAHASARSQTSKNVKHVARSGGRGIDAYQRLLGQGPSSAAVLSHPTLPQEEEGWYRGPCGPFPALPKGCEGSWGGAGASWIGKGAAGQGPG